MTKHTPGPWQVEIGNQEHGTIKSKKYTIAKVDCRYGQIGEPEANARLIAAAPEMLEVLIHVESLFGVLAAKDLPNTPSKTLVEMIQSLKTARAVIAKATGK